MITELVKCRNPQIIKTIDHPKRSIPKNWLKPLIRKGETVCAWCAKNPLPPGRRKYCSDECLASADAYCYPQTSHHAFRILMLRQNFQCEMCTHSYWSAFVNDFERQKARYRKSILDCIKRIKTEIPERRKKWLELKKSGKPNVGYSGRDEFGHWTSRPPIMDDKQINDWVIHTRNTIKKDLCDYFNFRKRGPQWEFRTADNVRSYHRNLKDNKEPEIDHIIPIFKGGMAIGLDNVQILCYSCHKKKTKKDLEKPKAPARSSKKKKLISC
ncbi:MAG: HNH endonuclease [Bacteriovoracaceae bacterium]|jgi:5-methylcytosine-specific restriction endonuclease McrA